jgi:hypothetical protein
MSSLRSLGRSLAWGFVLALALVAVAQPATYDEIAARRDVVIQELEDLEARRPPPGSLYYVDPWAGPSEDWLRDTEWRSVEDVVAEILRAVSLDDVASLEDRLAVALAWHAAVQRGVDARAAELRAEIAALDARAIDALARAPAPTAFDWDLTGSWHAEVPKGWDLANLEDLTATLHVPSLTGDDAPTLTLRIANMHFVPGWTATVLLRPRVGDVEAMLDGNPLTTVYPVGAFDGPLGPRSLDPEETEPGDRVDHHCEAWDEPGGIGRIHVVDPGGPAERLELELRFEGVHCDDGVPVEIRLTLQR